MAAIALVDDHILLREGLAGMLRDLGHTIVFQAANGTDCLRELSSIRFPIPDLVLLDVNMPGMDGYETAQRLQTNYPSLRVLILSMYDDEHAIIRMIRRGARGYILKDCDPAELERAIDSVQTKGYYHSELVTGRLIKSLGNAIPADPATIISVMGLTEREVTFIELAATEKTYKEIADDMNVSPRTVDGYRDDLFKKLRTKNRVGIVIFGIRHGIVKI